jgi:hypothetical protein
MIIEPLGTTVRFGHSSEIHSLSSSQSQSDSLGFATSTQIAPIIGIAYFRLKAASPNKKFIQVVHLHISFVVHLVRGLIALPRPAQSTFYVVNSLSSPFTTSEMLGFRSLFAPSALKLVRTAPTGAKSGIRRSSEWALESYLGRTTVLGPGRHFAYRKSYSTGTFALHVKRMR